MTKGATSSFVRRSIVALLVGWVVRNGTRYAATHDAQVKRLGAFQGRPSIGEAITPASGGSKTRVVGSRTCHGRVEEIKINCN